MVADMSLTAPVSEARMITGAHAPVSVDVPRPRKVRPVTRDEKKALGTTRWASPPPGASWKAYALTLLAGDVGLVLIAHGMGWL